LLAGQPQLLLLVIAALTQLCAEITEVSEKIDPFIRRGLNQIEPRRPSGVLANFAYHFCFLKPNAVFTELIDIFVNVFARLREYVETFVKEHEVELWDTRKAQQSLIGLNSYVQGFTAPFQELLKRAISFGQNAEEIEWLQTLAKRILAALRPEERLLLKIGSFDGLVDWLKLLGSDELKEALPNWSNAESWSPILRLVKETGGSHPLFQIYISQAKPIPPALLVEIATWGDDVPPLSPTIVDFVRTAVVNWLQTQVEAETRTRVLAGLWRFSIT
jgi:hypothetical protein